MGQLAFIFIFILFFTLNPRVVCGPCCPLSGGSICRGKTNVVAQQETLLLS